MRTATPTLSDSYFKLVRRFPLVPIRRERQYDAAIAFLKPLAVRDEDTLDAGEQAYLEALTQFIEAYERDHHRIEAARFGPLDALKYLMRENNLRPADLGRILGNRSLATQILRARRALSKAHIVRLADHFKVQPGLFLDSA